MPAFARPFALRVESLESRDVPSAVLSEESFESASQLPAAWSSWSNGADAFLATRLSASDGEVSLASRGTAGTVARAWDAAATDANAGISIRVRTDAPSPVAVLARGSNLNTDAPSYVSATLDSRGRALQLLEVNDGQSRQIAVVGLDSIPTETWLDVTLQPFGGTASVRVSNPITGQFLNGSGAWQSGEIDALAGTGLLVTEAGVAGLSREPGGAGLAFFDEFEVTAPPMPERSEAFDSAAVGSIPQGWSGWTNHASGLVAVSKQVASSGTNSLALKGTAQAVVQAWVAEPQPADVQAGAAVLVDTLVPATLLVRGSNLGSSVPSYYGVSVVRGVEAKLVLVNGGATTVLDSIKSKDYVSNKWLKLTLTAKGDSLRAVVFRTDSGKWLTSDGLWSDVPQPALEATDATILGGGIAGLARTTGVNGTTYFDDFAVKSAKTAVGPAISVTASQTGTTFSGDVTLRTTGVARRVEYRLGGRLRSASAVLPAEWTLDTTLLANGAHELTVWAVDETGNVTERRIGFVANNADPVVNPVRVEFPRHYEHIRIAQLAYSGNPMGEFEKARLRDSVDLVIPNAAFLSTIEGVAPETPKIVYTNVSNLYQGLLTDWLNTADAAGSNRELAFYHAAAATPFTGGSPSSQPVNWFWSVARRDSLGVTDLTSAARAGRTTGVRFGGVGDDVAIGYVEKFREINLTLTTPASAGWQGVWEYPTALGTDGVATQWKALPMLRDSSNGFTIDGQVLFDPPADWVAAKNSGGGERLFFVRLRTTAGTITQAPETKTILGRDFVGANGTIQGTIPAFDFAADRDGDGYLSQSEYVSRKSGFDARFVYETRLFYPYYGQMRFATNPSSSAVRRWAADYHTRLATKTPLGDGFFLDNSLARLALGSTTIEPLANYAEDYASMVQAVWRAIAPRSVVSNTAGGWADADLVTANSTAVLEEFLLRPADANWANFTDVANLVASRLNADSPSPYVILDTLSGALPRNDPRLQSATLAYYYLLADPDRTLLMFFGGQSPSAPWSTSWIPAVSTNVGQPTRPMSLFATGADPQNAALAYKVYARSYSNALVLYKPRSYALAKGTGTLDDATATAHALGGNYRVLAADGSLGPVVASIQLRNGEGAILIRDVT